MLAGPWEWNKPIYLSMKALTEEMDIVNYDHQLYQLTDNIFPEYVCQVEVKRKGKIRVILGYENLNGEIIFDETNPFRTKDVILK